MAEIDEGGQFLVVGDSALASTLLPQFAGRVALAVTSPPYHNAISYEAHVLDPTANYRPRQAISYSDEYLPFLDRIWAATFEMLRPGGYLAINVGTVLLNGAHYPLPQDIVSRTTGGAGPCWEYIRSIIWNKVTAGVKRAGSVIQHRLPGYWYPNIMTEHIIVLRKPGPTAALNTDVPEEWWEPVWDLAPVPPRQVPHPAPFPEDLPHRLIRMLTAEGDPVLDPFLGAGATTKAAFDLGRLPLGIDVEPSYVEYSRRRLAEPSLIRSAQLTVRPVRADEFVPGRSRGKTRHGAGLAARR